MAGAKPYDVESGGFKAEGPYADQSAAGYSGSGVHANLRNAFIRKVYGILSVQLLFTTVICAICALHVPTQTMLLRSPRFFMYGALIPSIICMVALSCYKNVYPANSMLLAAFTFFESITLGVICATFQYMEMGDILIQAAFLTLSIFIGLTLYAHISKTDFSFLQGWLFAGAIVFIGWGLMNLVFGWRTTFLKAAFGALLFCGYILFDTWQIINTYGYDDHIMACISLYLDIINLFINILQLLAKSQDRR